MSRPSLQRPLSRSPRRVSIAVGAFPTPRMDKSGLPPPAPSARRYSFHQALEAKRDGAASSGDISSVSPHSRRRGTEATPASLLVTDGVPDELSIVRRKSECLRLPLGNPQLKNHLQAIADAAMRGEDDSPSLSAVEQRRSFRVRRAGDGESKSTSKEAPGWLKGRGSRESDEDGRGGRAPSPLLPSSLALFGAGATQTILVMGSSGSGKSSVVEALRFQERFDQDTRNSRNYIEIHEDQDDLWRTLGGVVGILVVFLADKDKSFKAAQETLGLLHASSLTAPLILVATKAEHKSKGLMASAEKLCRRMGGVELVEVSARLHTNVAGLSAMVKQLAAPAPQPLSPPSPSTRSPPAHASLSPRGSLTASPKAKAALQHKDSAPPSALASLLNAPGFQMVKSCENIPIAS